MLNIIVQSSLFSLGLNELIITLSMLGKGAISVNFAIIYQFSAELFPTVVRNSGIGVSSMCARVGGLMAPFISLLVCMMTNQQGWWYTSDQFCCCKLVIIHYGETAKMMIISISS